ncbi:hypothetical protein LTR85_001692 [Meristemomyces frigidus]|nr:hypothetical protein LTR85_001692 [Meristemomyces frigidus]
MYGMGGTNLPYRERKDLAHMRGLSRKMPGFAGPSFGNMWTPMGNQDFYGRGPPGMHNRFEEFDDSPLPRMPSDNSGYGNPYAKGTKSRTEYSSRNTVSFDKAADALFQELQFAIEHCKGVRDHFARQVERSAISSWCSPKVVDALWTMNAEWTGIDLASVERNPTMQPIPGVVTFTAIAKRLSDALKDLKAAGFPRMESLEDRSNVSPEVVMSTLKRLQVTTQGIEHLMQSVRKDRRVVEPLVKEMEAAVALLGDIEDVWRPATKPRAGKARAKWDDDDDFVWPDYRGDRD